MCCSKTVYDQYIVNVIPTLCTSTNVLATPQRDDSVSPDGLNFDGREHLLHCLVDVGDPDKPDPFLELS